VSEETVVFCNEEGCTGKRMKWKVERGKVSECRYDSEWKTVNGKQCLNAVNGKQPVRTSYESPREHTQATIIISAGVSVAGHNNKPSGPYHLSLL
jgi:hypothetical protein